MDEEERERIRRETVAKWSELGFLDGFSDRVTQLYESQAQHLLVEETNGEVTTSEFETVVFPMVRRVYARTLFRDLVSYVPDLRNVDFKPNYRVKKHKL